MEEKNSQENVTEVIETVDTIEPIKPTETAIEINGPSSEIKDDILSRTKKHRENIGRIIVPQYIDDQYVTDNNYIVTYSNKDHDNSVLGWTISNIEEDGQQQPDVYFKLDQKYNIGLFGIKSSLVLYKKTLIFCYRDDNINCKYLF